ncbi:MAG: hypothetical protein RJB36_914 [Bacteroidota bacterium]|jgi:hypothetical protein
MALKLGFISALLAGTIGALYTYFYYDLLFDFSSVLPVWKVFFGLCSFTLILFYCQQLFTKVFKRNATFWFGFIFSITSFTSILYPITEKIYVDASEFYPGFVIPLHFLPMLMVLTFYTYNQQK